MNPAEAADRLMDAVKNRQRVKILTKTEGLVHLVTTHVGHDRLRGEVEIDISKAGSTQGMFTKLRLDQIEDIEVVDP